ncbi:MAG TPA: hypothetical protein VGK19_12255 [Capsulimonadaceae bacterium]
MYVRNPKSAGFLVLIACLAAAAFIVTRTVSPPMRPINLGARSATVLVAKSQGRHVLLRVRWADAQAHLQSWFISRDGDTAKDATTRSQGASIVEKDGYVIVDLPRSAPAGEYHVTLLTDSSDGSAVFIVQ